SRDKNYVRCVRGGRVLGPDESRFSAYDLRGDGTVRDTWTGLTWQVEPYPSVVTPDAAAAACAGSRVAGGGWRVPSVNELQTLVDESQPENGNPSIYTKAIPGTTAGPYLTSSALRSLLGMTFSAPYVVDFANGRVVLAAAGASVRCVRDADPADSGAAAVTDGGPDE